MANNSMAPKQEMEVDWQINKSILECHKYLFENKMNCDVKFKVGKDQEIVEANKFILSTRSPVFERMFNGSFKESEIDPVIPDVRPAAFTALLRYCYYEFLDIEGEVALSVLYAATKYMLPILEGAARKTLIEKLDSSKIWETCKYSTEVGDDELHAGCIKYLKGNLNSSNLHAVFEYAVMTRHEELQSYCRNHFQENLSETNILDVTRYLATTDYKDLHAICRDYLKEHLTGSNIWEVYKYALDERDTEVLQSCRQYFERDVAMVQEALHLEDFIKIQYELLLDVMHINDKVDNSCGSRYDPGVSISEIELFRACNRWAEAECQRQKLDPTGSNKRKVLGECLPLIRFPTMLQKDLLTIVYPTGILTQERINNLSQYIYRDLGAECQVDFPSQRRKFMVKPSGDLSSAISNKSTVHIEAGVRVLLTRIWTLDESSSRVTVRNESSQRSWSMLYNTKHEYHVEVNDKLVLHYIDIEPQLLEAGTRYSVTTKWKQQGKSLSKKQGVEYIKLQERCSGYKGIRITQDRNYTIYALTFSLV